MKRVLLALLLTTGPALAEDFDNTNPYVLIIPNVSRSTSLSSDYYTFEPKPDITTIELAKAMLAIMPGLAPTCAGGLPTSVCDVRETIKQLPPEVLRHFVYHQQ